jgi:ferredoxin--NADP+ reductase
MAGWLEGRVVENRHWTETLFSLRVEAPALRFEAGQFVKLALDLEGERLARPFSFVNPPHDPTHEFYGVIVPEGGLSPRLARLVRGDAVYLSDNPSGFLVLSEVPEAETLWLLATGTGVAPFLSILRSEAPWRRYENVVLVHGVRHARELVYREMIESVAMARKTRFRYVTFVSRETGVEPPSVAGERVPVLEGRIPGAIRDGRLERAAGGALSAQGSQVMLCGNPDMLRDATEALKSRGLRKHRRRAPGQITVESFW